MLCPHCKVELKITDRQGIEIDYCPNCRGVWLDRGELDKILDRAATAMPGRASGGYAPQSQQGGYAAQPQPGGYPPQQSPGGYPPQQPYGAPPSRGWRRDHDDDDDDDDDRRRYYGQPGYPQPGYPQQGNRRRRESWLSDLFDFD